MKKPNFFIVGAPKCGTTSMASWLSEHPNVYLSPIKEPHYFSNDIDKARDRTLSRYESLFKQATDEHKAIGESSVFYLYSDVAVSNILQYSEDPKFIVMIRNPVEMAYSFHEQLVFATNEHIKDFRKAWFLQDERKEGRFVSKWCIDSKLLLYGEVCKLGKQIERLYSQVGKQNVLTIVMDDLKNDTRNEYKRVLDFLEVSDDGRMSFDVHNTAKSRKSESIRKIVKFCFLMQRRLKIPRLKTGIMKKFDSYNTVQRSRKPLDSKMKEELKSYFKDDVYKLSDLIGRDLTQWVR